MKSTIGVVAKYGAVILLSLAVLGLVGTYVPGKSCTIFTAVQGETVLFGNNEDQHNRDPMIGFFPPSSAGFGSVHFGIRSPNGQVNFEGAVNDHGLAWDINGTPRSRLNPQPEKPYFLGAQNYLTTITKSAATVEDAIRIADQFSFGDSMVGQIHIADASGAAVVISAGPDGELAFTRKSPGEGYHLSTNFNLAQPERGPVDFRWETAASMLAALRSGQDLTPAYAGEILEAVHLETLTSYTLYSNVLDLRNNKVYIFYMAQFDEMAEIDMEEEFTKGERVLELRELFTPSTAAAGDASYHRFATRFMLAIGAVITLALALIIACSVLLVRYFRKKAKGKPNKAVAGLRSIFERSPRTEGELS